MCDVIILSYVPESVPQSERLPRFCHRNTKPKIEILPIFFSVFSFLESFKISKFYQNNVMFKNIIFFYFIFLQYLSEVIEHVLDLGLSTFFSFESSRELKLLIITSIVWHMGILRIVSFIRQF